MAAPESILNKIKLLYKLAESPNLNEAQSARDMADKLIAKYNISPDELKTIAEKASAYTEDELLFTTDSIVPWKTEIALGLAVKFDCKVIQEQCVPGEGISIFNYYVYGEDEDIHCVKYAFPIIEKKIEQFIIVNCEGRGPLYSHSYSDGIAQTVRANIESGDLILPTFNRNIKEVHEKSLNNGTSNLTVQKPEKEAVPKETVNIRANNLIKDINAYFKGVTDGNKISIQDTLNEALSNNQLLEDSQEE